MYALHSLTKNVGRWQGVHFRLHLLRMRLRFMPIATLVNGGYYGFTY